MMNFTIRGISASCIVPRLSASADESETSEMRWHSNPANEIGGKQMQTKPETITKVIGQTLILIAVLLFLLFLFFPSLEMSR